MLKNNSENVPTLIPSDPQKPWFRVGGVAKITKSAGRQKVTKMSPTLTPKSTLVSNLRYRFPRVTLMSQLPEK